MNSIMYMIYHTQEEDMHPYILRYRGYSEAEPRGM